LHNEEPIVNALVHDLKEAWEHSVDKQTAAPSAAPSAAHNNHASASFDVQQQHVSTPLDPAQPNDLQGRAPANGVCSGAASKIYPSKAASCTNIRKSTSISGPWSFDWIKDHHLGDVGVVFSHKKKKKVMHQRHKLPLNPSLINLRCIARMPLKDRQNLIHMLKKLNKKSAAPSSSYGSKNKESLDVISSSTLSGEDWKNWIPLHDKSNGGGKDIIDIGKAINLQFKGDCSNMFQVLCRPNKLERNSRLVDDGVEGSQANILASSVGC